jgi:methylmalonyl-CoA epimerase
MAKLAHVGIVVRSIEEALPCYTEGLGLKLDRIVELQPQRIRIAILPLEMGELELLQPLDDTSGVAKFLASHGEGIHHVCLEVGDIYASLDQAKGCGLELIDEKPRQGATGQIAFLHPKTMHGVLMELLQERGPAKEPEDRP